ncbi:glycosyltransferase family A protein [Salinimicrobium sp. TIG7-5_MAKvit]|uniref:glycosyltransferase family 2 protein n=1 Tax=Salinimicrobium sp. TIG7-5_MAKvit TaxID=3121289 RepID=UPI003C6E650E
MPLISIITPIYNNAKSIGKTISSILAQTFKDWQLILVDDGSQDNLEDILELFLDDKRIQFFKQGNKGVSHARNRGIKEASGTFLTFLDSDDQATSSWLEDFSALISSSLNPGFVSCGYMRNNTKVYPKLFREIVPEKYSSLAGTFCIKKEITVHIGGYDVNLKQSENWEFTARALEYCKNNNLDIMHTKSCNFLYHHDPNAQQTKIRDGYRGEATYYLFKKYSNRGVLHFRKKDFLLSSAVNFTRAGKFQESRKVFYENLKTYPSWGNLAKVLIFEIPFLRRKKWMRN